MPQTYREGSMETSVFYAMDTSASRARVRNGDCTSKLRRHEPGTQSFWAQRKDQRRAEKEGWKSALLATYPYSLNTCTTGRNAIMSRRPGPATPDVGTGMPLRRRILK